MTARACECGRQQHLVGLDQQAEIFECSSGHRESVPTGLAEALAERDSARDLAAGLEAQLARIADVVDPAHADDMTGFDIARVLAIREILEVK